jgi:actin-related protein
MSPEGPFEAEATSASVAYGASDSTKSKKKFKRKGSMPEKIRSSIGSVKRTLTTKKRASSSLTRTNTVDSEGIGNVSVLKPLTTQEWDPTCLLEELYSDYKQGLVTGASSGEGARHCGYLDKLPTNRTKANVMTKWKRRYFRAQEGNIYYYQDRRAERALGFIHLQSSRVIPIPEKLQIQIIPKDGKSIMLKVPDKDELQAWHRALLLEAAHPTLIAPSSPKPAMENPIIIIDVGACSVRAGLVREDPYPEIFFPAVSSFDADSFEVIECGLPALLPDNRYKAQQVYPRKVSLRMDRQRSEVNLPLKAMDVIVSTIMMQLDIDPQVAQLIMTLPPTAPEQERDDLVELLLDTFGFAGICLQDQTQLALYSYNTTTGIIVDIGNHITVVPYIDGYAIEAGITRLPFGGNAITENLTKLVTMKGMRYFSETEMFINRFIKESLCYVSQSYEEDLAECDKDPKNFIRGVDVDRFQLPDHRKMVTLDASLFKAPEGLFSPHLWGKDVPGLHEIVWKAIQACPIDQRREVSKNIFLSGGSSVIPGLKERLQKEVGSMAPTGVAIEVHTRGSFHHAAYCGASVLASLGSFQNYLVSWDDWSTAGAEALKKWTGS